jgi:hypothetical protein
MIRLLVLDVAIAEAGPCEALLAIEKHLQKASYCPTLRRILNCNTSSDVVSVLTG